MNFLSKLLDTSDFPERWHCGNWSPIEGWMTIFSDLGISFAYMLIPFVIMYFIKKQNGSSIKVVNSTLYLFAAL